MFMELIIRCYIQVIIVFDAGSERFDSAKLLGWKLQCFTSGIGIWIHNDVKELTPFFLDEEYEQIEQNDYDNNLKLYKK